MTRAPDDIDLDGGAHLRLFTPADAPTIFETVDRNRERLRRWLAWVDSTTRPADIQSFIETTNAADGNEYAYGIWAANGFAGAIGLHMDPAHRSSMIGYWIDEEHEGHGLVTKAVRALTDVAFRSLDAPGLADRGPDEQTKLRRRGATRIPAGGHPPRRHSHGRPVRRHRDLRDLRG